jgi:hypothetical protein
MTRRTKQIISGVVVTVAVLAAVLVLALRVTAPEPQLNQTVKLPPDYDRPASNAVASAIPKATELADKTYTFGGHTYSLKLEIDKPYFPYLSGGKVTGTITLLRDGRPIKALPDDARANYAPNRPDDPLLVAMSVNGLLIPHMCTYGLVSPVGINPQTFREPPLILSYVYSPDAVTAPGTAALCAGDIAAMGPDDVYLDLSKGRATFELINGGPPPISGIVQIELAASIGPLVEHDWTKALMFTNTNLFMEDRVRNYVEIPDPTTAYKNADTYYDIDFSVPNVTEGKEQQIDITVTAFATASGKIDTNSSQTVVLVAHPLRNYVGYSQSGTREMTGISSINSGEFIAHLTTEPIYGYSSYSAYPLYNYKLAFIEITLQNGTGQETFKYNGQKWLAPYLAFSVLPADVARWLNHRSGWSLSKAGPMPGAPYSPAPFVAKPSSTPSAVANGQWFPYTTKTLAITSANPPGWTVIPSQPWSIWLWFLIYQAAKLLLGGAGLIWIAVIRRRRRRFNQLTRRQ